MAKLHIKNTDGTFTPYSTIAVTNLDIVQGKGNSLTSAMSQKAVTDEFGTIQDAIASIVNAGYVFAGVATPSTNPGTPEAKVFYIANGKGTYTNFGGLGVTEDEVVVLYYDTAWHKVSTGIASQEKLTELEKEMPLKDTKEDGFAICNEKGEAIARYVGDKWVLSGSAIGKSQNGVVSVSHVDMTADSKVILLGSNSVQNHKSMAFSGIINGTFNGISLGHGYKGYFLASWIDVTSTDIVVHNFTSTEAVYTYPHGLTIENNIQVIITIGYKDKKIKVVSNGISFEQDLANKYMGAALDVWVKSSSELIDCSMSWACPKLQNGVWIFGDSYYTLGDNKRWVTHLFNDGFVNSIVVARSGETDFGGLTSLNTLLKVATPRCIVWGLGMNDHDISATEYNVNWKNVTDRVIAICKENGVDLILATIPSAKQDTSTEGAAPNDAIHEAKNTYIRTSGMKYIDFAKAVGATSEGVWFNGMKEDTGVHPTEKGARALYMQAVADAPEIMI